MTQINPDFSIKQAISNGQNVFDLVFTQWGQIELGITSHAQWPNPGDLSIPSSLAGIAIGPHSDVDRVWMSINRQTKLPPANAADNSELIRRVSLDAPLTFPQAAGFLPVVEGESLPVNREPNQAMQDGIMYVWAFHRDTNISNAYTYPLPMEMTLLPVSFIDGFTGATQNFGATAGDIFISPTLHLQLYLKQPVVPQTKRFPYFLTRATHNDPAPQSITGASPTMLAQIPIFGRSRIRIVVVADAAGATFTAGVIRNINGDALTCFEVLTATQAASAGVAQFMTITDPCADYLILWGLPKNPGDTIHVQWSVTAYDGPGTMQGC